MVSHYQLGLKRIQLIGIGLSVCSVAALTFGIVRVGLAYRGKILVR